MDGAKIVMLSAEGAAGMELYQAAAAYTALPPVPALRQLISTLQTWITNCLRSDGVVEYTYLYDDKGKLIGYSVINQLTVTVKGKQVSVQTEAAGQQAAAHSILKQLPILLRTQVTVRVNGTGGLQPLTAHQWLVAQEAGTGWEDQ